MNHTRALLRGVPPSRIGWSSGPLTALRLARHRRLGPQQRPVRLVLLERHTTGTFFGPPTAFWLNERSRVVRAEVNGPPEDADLVWVFTQDPLAPEARAALEADLARVRPGTPVLNPLSSYDAYHADDCFPRLAAAGVRVPRHVFGPADVGRTRVVYKRQGEQASRKDLAVYDGPRPGYRAFELVDGRGRDGRWRRYRIFFVAGAVLPTDVIVSGGWEVGLGSLEDLELTFTMTGHERDQVALVAATLGLDAFCVDVLRRAADGLPVVVDVNVYPTMVVDECVSRGFGDLGQWHFWDVPARAGLPWPTGRSAWELVDEALLRVVREGAAAAAPPS